jgi:isocitrate dehydrogenase (NAD+)
MANQITDSVKEIFEACNAPIEFEEFKVGRSEQLCTAFSSRKPSKVSGETSQDEAEFKKSVDSLRRNKVGLKGWSLPSRTFPGSP